MINLSGCKAHVQSQTKHTYGETQRGIDNFPFVDCHAAPSSPSKFPLSQKYVQAIADNIMSKNSNVFRPGGPLDPEKFCFRIESAYNFNASATAQTRTISVNTGTILTVESDAEISATLSHELAHISLLHRFAPHPALKLDGTISQDLKTYREFNLQSSKWYVEEGALVEAMVAILNQGVIEDRLKKTKIGMIENITSSGFTGPSGSGGIGQFRSSFMQGLDEGIRNKIQGPLDRLTALAEESNQAGQSIREVERRLNTALIRSTESIDTESVNNWTEAEADEAGLEFFIRAGFPVADYLADMGNFGFEIVGQKDCMPLLAQAAVHPEEKNVAPRGAGTHPDSCWRMLNVVNEMRKHGTEYGKFPGVGKTIVSNALTDAKAEIAAQNQSRYPPGTYDSAPGTYGTGVGVYPRGDGNSSTSGGMMPPRNR
jgi:hypothetical protein